MVEISLRGVDNWQKRCHFCESEAVHEVCGVEVGIVVILQCCDKKDCINLTKSLIKEHVSKAGKEKVINQEIE
jgi:hypothetical protein